LQIPDTSGTTLAVGAGSLGVLLLMRYRLPRWPRMVSVMALAIVAVELFGLTGHGVAVTGDVPTGTRS
jgi:sulfate permease, SulP family